MAAYQNIVPLYRYQPVLMIGVCNVAAIYATRKRIFCIAVLLAARRREKQWLYRKPLPQIWCAIL
jgi:hypothetical protein